MYLVYVDGNEYRFINHDRALKFAQQNQAICWPVYRRVYVYIVEQV